MLCDAYTLSIPSGHPTDLSFLGDFCWGMHTVFQLSTSEVILCHSISNGETLCQMCCVIVAHICLFFQIIYRQEKMSIGLWQGGENIRGTCPAPVRPVVWAIRRVSCRRSQLCPPYSRSQRSVFMLPGSNLVSIDSAVACIARSAHSCISRNSTGLV